MGAPSVGYRTSVCWNEGSESFHHLKNIKMVVVILSFRVGLERASLEEEMCLSPNVSRTLI